MARTGIDRQKKADDGSYEVAGLLDVAKLLTRLGKSNVDDVVRSQREAAKMDPVGTFNDMRVFIDPRDRLMMDTGQTFGGKPLPYFASLNTLVEKGPTLQEYLGDTELAGMLGDEMSRIRVGRAPLGQQFSAGFTDPTGFVSKDTGAYQTVQPGLLAVNSDVVKEDIGPLFEHELQHALQYALGQPRGANTNLMIDDYMDYYVGQGILSPDDVARMNAEAASAGTNRPMYRYLSTTGEAEARVPQYHAILRGQGVEPGMPALEDYAWTGEGYDINPRGLFDLTEDPTPALQEFWKKKWSK